MPKNPTNELMLSQGAEISIAQSMYTSWLADGLETPDNTPHSVLKAVMGVEIDIDMPAVGASGKATVMEAVMLKLAEKAMEGNLTATQMIIKEIQHDGVDKVVYADELPDDVKYLFTDVNFTDITLDEELKRASMEHRSSLSDDKANLDVLLTQWD